MQQISHNRPAADQGIVRVARHHLRVNTVSQARMYKLYSLPSDWQRVHVEITVNSFFWPWITVRNCFQKFRTPTALMVQVKNKTQNWAIFDIGFFAGA